MTIDVEGAERSRPVSPPRPQQAGVVVRALADAPERLLLVFLWFCLVCAIAYVSGVFRPVVVFPAAAVVVALTWRLFPRTGLQDMRAAIGSVLSLAAAAVWFLVNLPYISERVQVTRDPDLYTLAALWLRKHSSPDIPVLGVSSGSLGFPVQGSALRPQGNHLVAGVSATAGWLFGQSAVFWGNLACGAAALVAVYVVARRQVGPLWALVPMVALAGSLPMLAFSRALYSEPLAMTFTFLGMSLLWSAWQSDRLAEYLLAGAALGGVALARIDGTLPLIGALAGLTVAALIDRDGTRPHRRWAAPLVMLGSAPGVLLGFLDLYLHTGVYLVNLRGQLEELAGALALVGCLALVFALWPVPLKWQPATRRIASHLAIAGAALIAVGFVVLLTRPWWYVSHGVANSLVQAIQQRERLPVDGTRLYAEDSMNWLSWYYGWPVVIVGLGGLLAWLVVGARTKATHLLWLSALFIPSAVLYVTQPNITPDQVWAMRRFLPVVVPGLLLATAWVARELAARRVLLARLLAAALVLATVAWPLTTLPPMWSAKDKSGALAGNEEVCQQIHDRPTIVTGVDTYLPTVLVLCDVPAVSVPNPTPALLAQARTALGGGSVVLVTRAPGSVPWVGHHAPSQLAFFQKDWETSLSGPPDEVMTEHQGFSFGLVRPDGSVVPLDE
jgi:hypothetical protein